MSMLWSDGATERETPDEASETSELTGIEVDEVSLVDRPATGRRFVLFKRGGLARRARGGDANKCSPIADPVAPAGDADRDALAALQKRAEAVQGELARLADRAARLEERLEAVERGRPARQSEEAAAPRGSLWRGVL